MARGWPGLAAVLALGSLALVSLVLLLGPTPSTAAAGFQVPAWVKPGARVLYESGSATQPDFNKPGSAGVGITRTDVVAVTGAKVLLRSGSFLSDGRGGYSFGGGSFVVVDAAAVSTGATLWIDPTVLSGFRTDEQTTVVDGGWQAGGRDWQARSLTRLASDSASRLVFDRATGLLLAQQLATGAQRPGMTDPFMRQNTSSMSWLGQRQVDLPWAGGASPAWTSGVQRLVYEGQQGMGGGFGPSVGMALRHTIEVSERGQGWATGTVRVEYQGQAPSRSPTGTGPGGLGAWWVDPAAMAATPSGTIDRDPTLGSVVTFEQGSGAQGPVGIVRESGSGYQLTWVYSLQDGALVATSFEQSSLGMRIDLALTGRQ